MALGFNVNSLAFGFSVDFFTLDNGVDADDDGVVLGVLAGCSCCSLPCRCKGGGGTFGVEAVDGGDFR